MKRYLPLIVILTAFLLCCVVVLAGCSNDMPEDGDESEIPYATSNTTGPEPENIWIEGIIVYTQAWSSDHSDSWIASILVDGEDERQLIESGCNKSHQMSVLFIPGDRIRFSPGNDSKVCMEEIELLPAEGTS